MIARCHERALHLLGSLLLLLVPIGALAMPPNESEPVLLGISAANPSISDPDAVKAGRKLFTQHCTACHGSDAQGSRRGPSLRSETVQRSSSEAIFSVLTNGVLKRGMPSWSRLPSQRRWQLIAYLRSLE